MINASTMIEEGAIEALRPAGGLVSIADLVDANQTALTILFPFSILGPEFSEAGA